ncbi:MAG: response regulator transcription factor, partial [Candidatus Omnitrophica bacterium]|nr:response regulator transcription factor [Candidatus Omnitrophota bacterium]
MPIRVAIVDDEPSTIIALETLLKRAGGLCSSGSYQDAQHALSNIPITKPDLVLMDIRMPDLSGIECTRQLKLAMPRLKVII